MAQQSDSLIQDLDKRGVRTTKDRIPRSYVGRTRRTAFAVLAADFQAQIAAGNPTPASLGGFYDNHRYARVDGRRPYEMVYGNEDYSASQGDPAVRAALDQVYGDRDGDITATGLSSSNLSTALSTARAAKNVRPVVEQARYAQNSQNSTVDVRDEELEGLTLVGDFEAPIDPVA